MPFDAFSPVSFEGIDGATGKPIYRLRFPATADDLEDTFTTDDLRSRWQMRFGARVSF